jgi:amino acid transporter
MTTEAETRNPEEVVALRRELRFWEAIALSIAIMAPTAAMALNGTVPAQLVGQAVPLAFIFATVGVIFVSYAFIRLSGFFSHAGSVYAFSGVTLGPRAGFFSGWALLGTYLAFTAASTAEAGLFGVAFFQGSGIWDGAEWLVIALVAGVLIALIAYGNIPAPPPPMRSSTRGRSAFSACSWPTSSPTSARSGSCSSPRAARRSGRSWFR